MMEQIIAFLGAFVFLGLCDTNLFIEQPLSKTVCPGLPTVSYCITSARPYWTINGGDALQNGGLVMNVNIPGGYINTTLTFNPESNVNYTLQCWVYFSDGHVPSTTATITTKCILSAVRNVNLSCSLNQCLLQWDPPYDALDPNLITYHIQFKRKLGSIIYDSYVNTTNVIFTSSPYVCDVIEVAITPLCGTLYGTKSSVMRPIDDRRFTKEDIVLRTDTSTNDCLAVLICLKNYYCNFSVLLGAVPLYSGDNGCAWSPCLSRSHVYPAVVSTVAQNISFEISTFGVSKVWASPSAGHVTISCLFGLGSQAKGCLVVLVHNTSNDVVFVAMPGEEGAANGVVTGLCPGEYVGRAYSLLGDGVASIGASSDAQFVVNVTAGCEGEVAPTAGTSPFLTKGTAICWSDPGLLAIYSVENSTVYLNHSSLLGFSVDLPPGKYSIAVLPDVNGTLGNTSVLGTWVEIPGTVTFQDDIHLLPLVALVGIAVVGIAICAVLHYLWKRFKKVDTTNLGEGGEEELAWIYPSHDAQGEGKSQVAISEGLPHARTARSPSSARSHSFMLLENINKPTSEEAQHHQGVWKATSFMCIV